MFNTVEDIYQSFLDGIRMVKQSVVKRDKFTRIWNEWALNQWVKDNLSIREGFEYSDKQIDDLQSLIVSTDGIYNYNGTVLYPIAPVSGKTHVFPLPTLGVALTIVGDVTGTIVFPKLKSLKKVWVYNGSEWIECSPLKAISEGFTKKSYYTGPNATRVYYKVMNNTVLIENNDSFDPTSIKYEYLRYPNTMVYNSSGNDITYTLDLGQDQLEEIRDMAVKLYLERVSDQRYKSFFQEDLVKNISQI